MGNEQRKLLLVNTVVGSGSTGRIVAAIAGQYEKRGWSVRIGDGRYAKPPLSCLGWCVPIGVFFERALHQVLTRLLDWHGNSVCSYFATWRFLRWAERWCPDVLWLHNIHGYYLNYELLFKWIKRHPDLEVKWTLHDCWAFTGHCSHFTMAHCEKWKTGCCGKCVEKRQYPRSCGLSAAKSNWDRKRKAFCGVKKMTLIAPSKWLADLTRGSFLKVYPVEVVHNTIDTVLFKPTPSDVKDRLGIADKRMILGVASDWDVRKGLDDFMKLRELLPMNDYRIVLVGLTQKQINALSAGMIGLRRTANVQELAALYSAADWFFNPTHEDNYPTVNLEAVACGCRVITYDVGGCKETVEGVSNAILLKENTPEVAAREMLK